MKLKCPACSKVLQVPETAAGKAVKCPCGSQIRVPMAAGAPAARPAVQAAQPANQATQPARSPAAANRPASPAVRPTNPQSSPAARQPMGSPSVDLGLFDELTEGDLQPVALAPVAGRAVKAAPSGGHGSNPYASMTAEAEAGEVAPTGPVKLPGTLIFLSVLNIIGVFFYGLATLATFGVAAMLPMMEDEIEGDVSGTALMLIGIGMALYTVFCILTAVSCYIRHWVCWAFILFAYAWSGGEFLFELAAFIARGDGTVMKLIQRAIFVICVMAYLHQEEPRRFYGTLKTGKMISLIADISGFILGAAFGAAIFFAAQGDVPE